jgi:hypothetical protein
LPDVVVVLSQRSKNRCPTRSSAKAAAKVTHQHRAENPTLRQAFNNMATEGTFHDGRPDAAAEKNFATVTARHKAAGPVSSLQILRIDSMSWFHHPSRGRSPTRCRVSPAQRSTGESDSTRLQAISRPVL